MAREKTGHSGETLPEQPRASLSVAELRQLITLMNGSDIEEIGIEEASTGLKLSLRKPAPVTAPAPAIDEETLEALLVDVVETEPASSVIEVRSPLVGVFRVSMKAGAKALCATGDVVREGQVICAVEALNVYNEVEASTSGRIVEIFVVDGQPVEFGQPLLAIEPVG